MEIYGLTLLVHLQSYLNMANFINKICGTVTTGASKITHPALSAINKINGVMDNRYSVDLDGTDDYIDISTSADNMNVNTGTISIWIDLDATSSNEAFFSVSTGTSANNKIQLDYLSSSAKWRIDYKGNTGGTATSKTAEFAQSNADAQNAGWTHFAATWDTGDADEIKLYVNGALQDTTGTLTHYNGTQDRVHLGKSAKTTATYHDGHLDNFALWTSVLTAAEIVAIYNIRNPDLTAAFRDHDGNAYSSSGDLIQWLRMLENTGTSLADSAGDSNTGTLVNGTAWVGGHHG